MSWERDKKNVSDQIEIKKVGSRTEIVYHKALIKGKVSPKQLLDSVLVASRMQAEMYINKLSRGAPLDTYEIRALKDLADIAKIKLDDDKSEFIDVTDKSGDVSQLKKTIYEAIANKLNGEVKN